MGDILSYWKLVLRFGIERADKRERLVSFGFLVIAPLVAVVLGLNFQFTNIQWALAIVSAILLDLLVIIPSKIGGRYIRMTKAKFSIVAEENAVKAGLGDALFWRIRVQNISKKPINRCYAQIDGFYWVNEVNGELIDRVTEPWPMSGQDLPWARSSGGGFERDLGPDEVAYVDYAMTSSRRIALFTIPTHPDASNQRPSYNAFRLPVGIYEVVISVCSKAVEMVREKIKFRFHFNGNQSLIEELPLTK